MGCAAHAHVVGSGKAPVRPVAVINAGPDTKPANKAHRHFAWSPNIAPSITEEMPKTRPVSDSSEDVETCSSSPPINVCTGVKGMVVREGFKEDRHHQTLFSWVYMYWPPSGAMHSLTRIGKVSMTTKSEAQTTPSTSRPRTSYTGWRDPKARSPYGPSQGKARTCRKQTPCSSFSRRRKRINNYCLVECEQCARCAE